MAEIVSVQRDVSTNFCHHRQTSSTNNSNSSSLILSFLDESMQISPLFIIIHPSSAFTISQLLPQLLLLKDCKVSHALCKISDKCDDIGL